MELSKLKTRSTKAFADKELFRTLYESCYRVCMPQRNLISETTPGAKRMEGVYTSVGIAAANGFVNNMQSTLTPAFVKWSELKAGSLIPEEARDTLNEALDAITEIVFDTINTSSFNVATSEMYYDLAAGTGAMLIMEGATEEKPIDFITVPIAHLALDEGPSGSVDGIWRKHKIQARLIKEQWKDAKIPSDIATQAQESPEAIIELVECTYYDYDKKKWLYCVFSEKHDDKIVTRSYEENPWVIVRWSKIAGEVYGRGPLLQALPDINTLNKVREYSLRSFQLNAIGVYTVADQGVINAGTLKISPGGFIPVERNSGPNGPSIAPLPQSGNFNIAQFEIETLKQDIMKLTMNNQLPPTTGPVRSATEIAERIKASMVDTGAAYGRLMFEFVQPTMRRIIAILIRKGRIQLPKEYAKIDTFLTKLQVLSPIAKQQNLEDVQSITQAMGMIMQIDPTGQTLQLGYKVEDVPEYIGNKLGVPAILIRNKDEREELTQQAAQLAATQAAAQQPQQ